MLFSLFPFRLVLEADCSCRTDRHRAEEIWTANPSATGHRVLGQNTASLLSFLTSGTAKYDASGLEKNKVATRAMSKLDSGPAMVIKISSLLRVLGLGSDILTGFPQPKIANPGDANIIIKGSRIVPIGSM